MSDELIRSFFRRWSSIEDDKAELASDSRELFAEAKSMGLAPKALRAAFQRARKADVDRPAVEQFEAEVELYLAAIDRTGMVHATQARDARVSVSIPDTAPRTPPLRPLDPGQGNHASDARPAGIGGSTYSGQSLERSAEGRGVAKAGGGTEAPVPPSADDEEDDITEFLRRA